MSRYRIDIFRRKDMAFKSFSEIDVPRCETDALVQVESTCTAPAHLSLSAGDFAQIRRNGELFYQGIVKDWNYNGIKTEIILVQMSNLLETEAFANVKLLKTQTIETWFGNLLTSLFDITSSDASEQLPGFTLTSSSSTNGTYTASDNGSYRLFDLAVSFFKVYGVVLEISFDAHQKQVMFHFRNVSSTVYKAKLNNSDVSSYEIESASETERPNKVIIKNANDTSQVRTYYWHENDFSGTVDTNGSYDRTLPVVTQCETVTPQQDETFADAAYDRAHDILYATRYDDLIKAEVRAESTLINTDSKIGQLFLLYDGNTEYKTMLTGKRLINNAMVEMTFGFVRKRLTEILKMRAR